MNAKIKRFSIKFKSFIKESVRVLKVTKKPNMVEFKTIVKASALGMLIVGMIGFVIVITGKLLGI